MTDGADENDGRQAAGAEDDRRGDPRQPIELKVEYKRLNKFFADYTKNICKGGTFIRTAKPLDVGTQFVFKLYVPKLDEPLRLHGEVKWIVRAEDIDMSLPPERRPEPGMGIRFLYADERERDRLESVVERLMVDSLGRLLSSKLLGKTGPRGDGPK
ncbi:MAG: TIGR02266 family protein [Deltaproteobacteria bacterium]|nr:MAG: TIGR02266 family protein [Deltaproteobacteria bacterium]